MDVRLTDEQQMLQAVATTIAADLAPSGINDLEADARIDRDRTRWSTLVDADLVALHVPALLGGSGAHVIDAALVAEQLAGSLVPVPFVGSAVWVPALLATAGATAAVEATAAGHLRLAPVLRPDLCGLAIQGDPGVAFDAQGATAGLVLDGDGRLFPVALSEATRCIDITRSLRRVSPSAPVIDVGVTLGSPLTPEGRSRAEAIALAVLAADLVGVAQRALGDAVAYVRERVQFGVPVGAFQAVQHLAAHATMLLEGARSSMWHGAWAADELPTEDALLAARQAKAFCSGAARQVGEISIQMFGGIGLTWEHLAHVRQRRTLLSRRVLGDEAAQYGAIAVGRLAGTGRR